MPDENADMSASPMQASPLEAAPAHVRILAGNPDETELAALVTVLAALSAGSGAGRADAASTATGWAAYWRSLGAPMPTFPGAWAAAGVNRT